MTIIAVVCNPTAKQGRLDAFAKQKKGACWAPASA
jgi:hypothetical protein